MRVSSYAAVLVLAVGAVGDVDRHACTTEYAPVCGTDGETYSNLCRLGLSGVELAYGGECGEPVVTYNSLVQLQHKRTKRMLASWWAKYPEGSGQYVVAGEHQYQAGAFTYWRVLPENAESGNVEAFAGARVTSGSVVRLQNAVTGRRLHSHNGIASPVSGQQEVTCFWREDANDDWTLALVDGNNGDDWHLDSLFTLTHVPTQHTLHSHQSVLPSWGDELREVTAYEGRDDNDYWRVTVVTHEAPSAGFFEMAATVAATATEPPTLARLAVVAALAVLLLLAARRRWCTGKSMRPAPQPTYGATVTMA